MTIRTNITPQIHPQYYIGKIREHAENLTDAYNHPSLEHSYEAGEWRKVLEYLTALEACERSY